MNKYFEIKNCPLCHKSLNIGFAGSIKKFKCPDINTYTYDTNWGMKLTEEKPHYEVIIEGALTSQTVILSPYLVISTTGNSISKYYNLFTNKLIMETPLINLDHPDKLVNKIKMLIIFS